MSFADLTLRPFALRAILIVVGLAAVGCRTVYVREPVTTARIIELSAEGRSPEEIIELIDSSRTIYALEAADIIDLHEKGVDAKVIEHMRRTEERERQYYYRRYYYDPYWYGPHIRFGFAGPYYW